MIIFDKRVKALHKYYNLFKDTRLATRYNLFASPLTAALLVSEIDKVIFNFFTYEERTRCVRKMFDYVENVLSPKELDIFDRVSKLNSLIIQGRLTPNGYWNLNENKEVTDNWIVQLVFLYVDLLLCERVGDILTYSNQKPMKVLPINDMVFINDSVYGEILDLMNGLFGEISASIYKGR